MAKCLKLFDAFAIADKKVRAKWMVCALQGAADAHCTYEVPEVEQDDPVLLYEQLKRRLRNPTDPYFYRREFATVKMHNGDYMRCVRKFRELAAHCKP